MSELEEADGRHLRWLALAHFVHAALTGLMVFAPGCMCCLGLGLVSGISREREAPEIGLFMMIGSLISFPIVLGYAALLALLAFLISRRRAYGLCVGLAVISCLDLPFGLLLGVATLIVLMRDSVRRSFD